jgi:sugar phosphate isomerase/epimerase
MDRNRVMPMDGKIDLKKFADNVKKIGFDGFVNIGVYNQKLWSINPLELCVDSIRRLRELFL